MSIANLLKVVQNELLPGQVSQTGVAMEVLFSCSYS